MIRRGGKRIIPYTLLEFRKNSKKVIEWAKKGERMIMTYRRKPILRLEPLTNEEPNEQDPFYRLDILAQGKGDALDNKKIDQIIYGL